LELFLRLLIFPMISGYIFIFSAANFPKMRSKWQKRKKKHSAPAFAND
jgi:hypothetical protein